MIQFKKNYFTGSRFVIKKKLSMSSEIFWYKCCLYFIFQKKKYFLYSVTESHDMWLTPKTFYIFLALHPIWDHPVIRKLGRKKSHPLGNAYILTCNVSPVSSVVVCWMPVFVIICCTMWMARPGGIFVLGCFSLTLSK